MADNAQRIHIYEVNKADGDDLLFCYFKLQPDDTYNFHDRDHKVKARDITFDVPFKFKLHDDQETEWTLTVSPVSDDPAGEKLGGTWLKSPSSDPSLEDGTYQAQAGGTMGEDAASAYA